jgi:hypothetical protein
MSEPFSPPPNAQIQLEAGYDQRHPYLTRIVIDGRDVSHQVRKVEFVAEGGETTDVRVTYTNAHVTAEGAVSLAEGGPINPGLVQHG